MASMEIRMMLVNLVRREISPGLDGGVDVSAWIRLRELLGLLDLPIDLDRALGFVFLSRNGGLMVYFTGVSQRCWLCFW